MYILKMFMLVILLLGGRFYIIKVFLFMICKVRWGIGKGDVFKGGEGLLFIVVFLLLNFMFVLELIKFGLMFFLLIFFFNKELGNGNVNNVFLIFLKFFMIGVFWEVL